MGKRYTLQQLLEHAANKEDIDRQAQHMEETLPSVPTAQNQVNFVHQKRHQKTKDKLKPKPAHDDKKNNTCQCCGLDHKGPRSQCPASGKTCGSCSKKGHFACKRSHRTHNRISNRQQSMLRQEEQEEASDSDFAFQLRVDKSNALNYTTVQVRINGVKGKMEADSCSTANIMDEHKFEKLQSVLEKITLQREDNFATHRYSVVCIRSKGTCSSHWLFRCRN